MPHSMSQSKRVTLRCSARLHASDVAQYVDVCPALVVQTPMRRLTASGSATASPTRMTRVRSPAASWPDGMLNVGRREAGRTGRDRDHGVELCAGGGDLDPGQLLPTADQHGELASAHIDHRHRVADEHLALLDSREDVDRLPGLDGRRIDDGQGDLYLRPGSLELVGAQQVARLQGKLKASSRGH